MNKVLEFNLQFAVGKGYFHENEKIDLSKVINELDTVASKMFDEGKHYISGMLVENRFCYKKDWGCPEGGERGLTYTSSANPEFVEDEAKWKQDCLEFSKKIKETFGQSTVTVTFKETDFYYLK